MTIEQIGSGGHETAVSVKQGSPGPTRLPQERVSRKGDVPVSADVQKIQQAVQQVEHAGSSVLEFSIDTETGKTVVKIIDSTTGDLVRQIPMEEMLALAKSLDRLQGLLLNTKA